MVALLPLCCLVVVGAAVARPNGEVSQRDARGQTIVDTSNPFWVFHTPNKPLVYIPSYDALLVPAPEVQPYTLQGPGTPSVFGLADALHQQPPRRRRPILALLDLLQRRYSLQNTPEAPPPLTRPTTGFGGIKSSNSTNFTEPSGAKGEKESEQGCKTNNDNDSEESTEAETTESIYEISTEAQSKDSTKVAQISKIYSLLDALMKEHPDMGDGFSYAYKYRVPHASSNVDKVEYSVQQSLNRFPQLSEDSLANVLKKPDDYVKAQEKLDFILEDKTDNGKPVHLNTPGPFGPLLLDRYLESNPVEEKDEEEKGIGDDSEGKQKVTKLMLKPVAKAVAGPRGVAVASPVARAIIRRGQRVTVEYEPDAVAIAGPGGRAHAHPQFSMEYMDKDEEY